MNFALCNYNINTNLEKLAKSVFLVISVITCSRSASHHGERRKYIVPCPKTRLTKIKGSICFNTEVSSPLLL